MKQGTKETNRNTSDEKPLTHNLAKPNKCDKSLKFAICLYHFERI